MKLLDSIKLGFGFYVGYEIASKCNEILGEIYPIIKERLKNGYC